LRGGCTTTRKYYAHSSVNDVADRTSVLSAERTESVLDRSAVNANQNPIDSLRPVHAEVQGRK
jgi:hypothetical protein